MNDKDCLEHLLRLAQRGKLPDASPAEQQSRRVAFCLLDNVAGLDDCAAAGIGVLAVSLSSSPLDGREAVREAIQ